MRSAAIALCLLGLSSAAFAQAQSPAIDKVTAPFKAQASPEQTQQLMQAIAASPGLQRELTQAVNSGKLKGIRLKTSGDGIMPPGPFGAFMDQGIMVLTPALLDEQTQKPATGAAAPVDIAPNVLTFVLGHMTQHAVNPPPTAATFALPIAPRADQAIPLENMVEAFQRARLKAEAQAYLQGWNDMVQAATRQNGGKALNEKQINAIMQSFRYRAPFITGAEQEGNQVRFRGNGQIDMSDTNIGAMARALAKSQVADIE